MKILAGLLFVAFISLFQTTQGQSCKKNIDVALIVEVPHNDPIAALKKLMNFFRMVVFTKNECMKFAITLVNQDITTILDFKCADFTCKMSALRKVSDMMNAQGITSISSAKENIVSVLKNLENDGVFKSDGGSREDAQKIIVLILSTKSDTKYPITDFTGSVLENGYKIIAIGVGQGRNSDLYRMTFERNRVVNLNDLSQLSPNGKLSQYRRILNLANDPNYRDPNLPKVSKIYSLNVQRTSANDEIVSAEEKCSYAVDIAFVVDSSYSIKLDYQKELLFVQRVANRFGISETGTHAGMVVFSDAKNYTKVTIKMQDYLDTKSFNDAVRKSPYIGYRTRIDYAFEKVKNELFTVKGGARPNMKKIIFLITDGYQNPTKDPVKKTPYDPVKTSQLMYDDGIKLFVVGIGQDLNKRQLEDIARDKKNVFYAQTIDQLISDDFVKNVSKKLCTGGKLPPSENVTVTTKAPCTIPIKSSCGGVGKCGSCCGSNDVYINIFQPNSGVSYVMQGMQVTQTGKGMLSGTKETGMKTNLNIGGNGKQPSTEQIMEVIKAVLPKDPSLGNKIAELLQSNIVYDPGNIVGSPGIARKSRRRRSVAEITEFQKQRGEDLIGISRIAGCNLFFDTLDKYAMLKDVVTLFTTKQLTVFCPIDAAFKDTKLSTGLSVDEKNLLLNHMAFRDSENKNLYQPMLKKGRIVLSKKLDSSGKFSWFANNIDILFSMGNNKNGQVIVIKNILKPNLINIHQVLKSNKNASIFYDIWKRSSIPSLFKTNRIKRVCFTLNQCVSVTKEMQKHLQSVLRFKQFTMLIPSNSMMLKMEKSKLKSFLNNKNKLKEFLQEFIYLGILNKHTALNEISHSLSSKHSLLTVGSHDNNMVVVNADQKAFKIIQSYPITEGIAHVIDEI